MRLAAIAAAVVLLAPIAGPAEQVQTHGSNVAVFACEPHRHAAGEAHPWIDPYGRWQYSTATFPSWDAFLRIAYENEAPLAATEVDFGLVAGGSLIALAKDVGTFAPGVRIEHEFVVSGEVFPLPSAPSCAVLRVRYADGSVWQNDNPPQP